MLRTGSEGCTTSTLGVIATRLTGVKSFNTSKLNLSYNETLIGSELLPNISV